MANWSWGVFVGEASAAFFKRLRKRTIGIPPATDFTDAQLTQAADNLKQLSDCSPMSDDLNPKALVKICATIKKGEELNARRLIENAKTPEGREWCIDALKGAVTIICTCGPTIIQEATFNLLGC
jgi:hypothetical protein